MPLVRQPQCQGHAVSERTVNRLSHILGYSLQSNRKTLEGGDHPDRDDQFEYLNRRVKTFQWQKRPVVSVDAKKKELLGQYRNGGREWRPKGQPEEVKVYVDEALRGWVSVGIEHDTAEFAVESLRRWWWQHMGSKAYPQAKKLLITADGAGPRYGGRRRSRGYHRQGVWSPWPGF